METRTVGIAAETTSTPVTMPPKSDRFLIGIVVAIVVLLVVAGISVVLLRQPVGELPAGTPGGTVQRFYTALEHQDYNAAYELLSDSMTRKPVREEFVRYNIEQRSYRPEGEQRRMRINKEQISGDAAGEADTATVTVEVTYFFYSGSPFGGSNQWTTTETFSLRREDGTWRITGLPYDYRPYSP